MVSRNQSQATCVITHATKNNVTLCVQISQLSKYNELLFNQSNHLKHSNKDCDWLILACFVRVQMHADATSVRSENEVGFKNEGECGGK